MDDTDEGLWLLYWNWHDSTDTDKHLKVLNLK